LLLDTHSFLWYLLADPKLSSTAHTLMAEVRHQLFLSLARVWEIGIKVRIDKRQIEPACAKLLSTSWPFYVNIQKFIETQRSPSV
jgi:PIN domain nuclease of toxin-antitoxin system